MLLIPTEAFEVPNWPRGCCLLGAPKCSKQMVRDSEVQWDQARIARKTVFLLIVGSLEYGIQK